MENEFQDLEQKIALDVQPTNEDYEKALDGAIQARAAVTYFIWKELCETYSQEEATKIMAKAYRKFGQYSASSWQGVHDAASALLAQTSKGGFLVFDQEFIASTPEYAQKDFHACPHMKMFKKLGATDEELAILCKDILSEGDYGNMDPFEGLSLEFKTQIGAGDDHCEYCVSCCK